jgi:putative DNA primase/helicase
VRPAVEDVLAALEAVKRSGKGWSARCPAHPDRNPSLSIWESKQGQPMVKCHAGCSRDEIAHALGMPDLLEGSNGDGAIAATYDYTDESGALLFQVVRRADKGFLQRRPNHGGWTWKLGGVRRAPYQLPKLIEAVKSGAPVWIAEGEKDVHALERLGFAATCNAGGAGKWREEYCEHLNRAQVIVVPDCDEPGRKHAQQVATMLAGIADEIRVLDLDRERDSGFDVSDWLADCRSDADRQEAAQVLLTAAENTPLFISPPKGFPSAAEKEKLPFAPASGILTAVPDRVDWTWDGFLAPGVLTVLAGKPKAGKSTIAFALVATLSRGEQFLGRKTKPTGALILSEERSASLAEKLRRFGVEDAVHLLMRHQCFGIAWPDVVAQAVEYCEAKGLGLLVVDTWDKWAEFPAERENDAGAVLQALEPLHKAAGKGLSALILPHQRKSEGKHGEAVRGSNALAGGVDVVVELERAPGDIGDNVRVLRSVSRFEETPEELTAELVEDTYRACIGLDRLRAEAERIRTKDALETLGEATTEELANLADLPPSSARRRLGELLDRGDVQKRGQGKRGDPVRWSISIHSATSTEPTGGGIKNPETSS